MDELPPQLAEIESILRRYLQSHPQAVDTERGIREWWLRDARSSYAARDVRAAIGRLVDAGELVERQLPDGECIYVCAGSLSDNR